MKNVSLFVTLAITATLVFAITSCSAFYGPSSPGTLGSGKQSGTGVTGNTVDNNWSNTTANVGPSLLGTMVGQGVAAPLLDRADMAYLNSSTQGALEGTSTGTISRWLNPDSGNSGTVTPTRTFQNNTGQFCRDYTQTIIVGGNKQNAIGTACRQPDGTWQIAAGKL